MKVPLVPLRTGCLDSAHFPGHDSKSFHLGGSANKVSQAKVKVNQIPVSFAEESVQIVDRVLRVPNFARLNRGENNFDPPFLLLRRITSWLLVDTVTENQHARPGGSHEETWNSAGGIDCQYLPL